MGRSAYKYKILIALTLVGAMSLGRGEGAWAQGGPRPSRPQASAQPRRVLRVDAIANRYIEMPSPSLGGASLVYGYGENIYARLISRLEQENRFVVVAGDALAPVHERAVLALEAADRGLDEVLPDPVVVPQQKLLPVAVVKARVRELSFETGERAEHMFYGFRPGFENPYNAGVESRTTNEFPQRSESDPTWFHGIFKDTGDLHFGVDLGSEINFDILLVGASLKYARYHARMGLELEVKDMLSHSTRFRYLTAEGNGFYLDLTGQYQGFSAGIMAARKAVMYDAFNRTMNGLTETLNTEMEAKPLILPLALRDPRDGTFYIAAGAYNYSMRPGVRFYDRTAWEQGLTPTIFEIKNIYRTVSQLMPQSHAANTNVGNMLVSLKPGEAPPTPPRTVATAVASSALSVPQEERVSVGSQNIGAVDVFRQFLESTIVRFFKGLIAIVTLPFRAARFFTYDQAYEGADFLQVDLRRAQTLARSHWALNNIGAPEAWQTTLGDRGVIVALLDTGVDYNHRDIRSNMFWDPQLQAPGFDFMSYDKRPYDDHAHGTSVAGTIIGRGAELIGVAPRVTLMPLKVFSAYGLTSSAALYSAFVYAIEKGARIIVCPWATTKESQALRDGVRLAQQNGVLVVTAAGDSGADADRTLYYPGALGREFNNVINVAALNRDWGLTRNEGPLHLSSNYGERSVDLAAPGGLMKVAFPRDGYRHDSHSGLSAGFVAGAAALVWSACKNAPSTQIKQSLLRGARNVDLLWRQVSENKALYLPHALQYMSAHCHQ